MKIPWASRRNRSRGQHAQPQKSRFGPPSHQRPMVNCLHFVTIVTGAIPLQFSAVQRCDPFQRFWSACLFYPGRRRGPTAAFSSSPTSRMATGSTSASPRARSAAPMPPSPIVSRGISCRPRPIAGSIRTKSPARFRRNTKIAAVQAVASTSPLPASAKIPPSGSNLITSTCRFRHSYWVPRRPTDATDRETPASLGFQCGFGFEDRPARLRQARQSTALLPPKRRDAAARSG